MQTMYPMISTSTGRVPVLHIVSPFYFLESFPNTGSFSAGSFWIIIISMSVSTILEYLILSGQTGSPTNVQGKDLIKSHEPVNTTDL